MFSSFVENLIVTIIITITIGIITFAFTHRDLLFPTVLYTLILRKKKVRISVASVLRLTCDGKYLLVRNLQRQESFGPFGGVYKYYSTAQDALSEFNFVPQKSAERVAQDRKNDLRGFVLGKDFVSFIRWFRSQKDRETSNLIRELKEELTESKLLKKYSHLLDKLEFKLVRTIKEHLMTVPGASYSQFRWLDIYDLVLNDIGQEFLESIFENAKGNTNLLIVTAEEIDKGRAATGDLIGSHVGFLLHGSRTRPEDTPF
jgi:hypothetical protein